MEEKADKIITRLTNALSQINPGEFMNQIKNVKESSEYIDISKKFCEIITNIKAQILFDISEEIKSLLVLQKDKPISDNNNDDNSNSNLNLNIYNNINNKDIKNILSQFKFKISNLSSNISDIYSGLNIISGNIKKQKYSLASLRIEKLIKLKDNINLNINSLEKLEIKLTDILKVKSNNTLILNQKKNNIKINDYNNNNKNSKSKIKIPKLNKTPSPINKEDRIDRMQLSTIQVNKKNIKASKINIVPNKSLNNSNSKKNSSKKLMINNKRKKSSSSISTISNISNISRSKSSIIHKKSEKKIEINKDKIKEKENIEKKIIKEQKEIIEKLRNEIKSIKNIKNNDKDKDKDKNILKLESNLLLFFNDKLRKISDLIFSITFSINNIQNKYKQISIEQEYANIKNYLINMTTEISEIKSNLLKMSLENENIFKKEEENDKNILNLNIENELNLSLYKNKIKNLIKENDNLKLTIEQLKLKINSLNELILSEGKEKENLNENNINNESTEISSLKEKLRINEKKLIEIKGIYDADIESKNIIEKLLRKNIDEMKATYEQKIIKLNKKLEEKGKEIIEKSNIISKMNYKKIKSINLNDESKRLSSSTNNDDILKINEELSKVRYKNDFSLENSITLSLLKEEVNEKNKNELINENKELKEEIIKYKLNENRLNQEIINYKNNYKQINDELLTLKLSNNKLINEFNYNIKSKDEILSLKEINSSFANEINSIKNTMNNNQKQEEKRNSGNGQIELFKSKTYSNESEIEIVNKLKSEINILQMNKKNLECQNNELNDKINKKDKEIICLITNNNKEKKNINEQYKNEIEKLKNEINEKNIINEQFRNEINILQKKLSQMESTYANGGEISYKKEKNNSEMIEKKSEIKFKNLEKKLNIILFIEPNRKWLYDEDGVEDYEDEEEEEDEETDEEFILKMKKINRYRINDNYEIKVYKKENRKMMHRYEDTLEDNNELKKRMIEIEAVVIKKQNELYNNLKKGFKALLKYLTINSKSKDNVIYFLNLIQFSEQEINIIMNIKK